MSVVKSDFNSYFGIEEAVAVPARGPSQQPANAPSAPLVPVATPKGKKVAAPKPVGTSLNNFVGWNLEGNKLKFTNKTDARAHRLALNAAISYGRSTDEDFKNAANPRNTTAGATVYWSASIAHIAQAPLPSDLKMEDDGMKCGAVKLPYPGSATSHAFYEAVKSRINRMPAKKFIGLGTGGVARALASVLGSEFTSFLDFVWFVLARARVEKVHVALEEEMKSKVGSLLDLPNLIVSKESHRDKPKVPGTYIYLSRVPAAGLRAIHKEWRPFLPSICGGEVFFGTSGVYNIDYASKVQLDTWETPFVHWFNFFGCLSYAKCQHVRIEEPASFSAAWGLVKKVNQGNVQQLIVGYAELGFGDEPLTPTIPLPVKEYRCDFHPGQFTHKTKPDPKPPRIVTEKAPDFVAHDGEDVIKTWTKYVGVPFDGIKVEGYWWTSVCLRCNKASFCTGEEFYQKSLVDVTPLPLPDESPVPEEIPEGWDAEFEAPPQAEDLSAALAVFEAETNSQGVAAAGGRTIVPPHYVEKKEEKVPLTPASVVAPVASSTAAGGKQVTMPLSLSVTTMSGALKGVHAGRITMDGRQIPFYVHKSANCFARLNNYKGLVIGEAKDTAVCGFTRHIALLGPDGQPFKLEGSLYGYVVVADKAVAVKITHTKEGAWYVNLDGTRYTPSDYDGCKLVLASITHHLLSM